VCDTDTGSCVAQAAVDGTACDDGTACTTSDSCQAGSCVGASPVSCPAENGCHDAGICNADTGSCVPQPVLDGTGCDDGDACTTVDSCQAGSCVGATPVSCPAADGCHAESICDTDTGSCIPQHVLDGTACDDDDACTTVDSCQAGSCVGASPVSCPAADGCHVEGICDAATGSCVAQAAVDGTACDDGTACTTVDSCQAGSCVGASPVSCPAADGCHVEGICDAATGSCVAQPAADGTACDDGTACTTSDSCQAGSCVGAAPVVCPSLGACLQEGSCEPETGTCAYPVEPDGTPCQDDDACTTTQCVAGSCALVDEVVCPAPTSCHQMDDCDAMSGACTERPALDGTPCEIGVCASGECVSAAAPSDEGCANGPPGVPWWAFAFGVLAWWKRRPLVKGGPPETV
jgi:hypothetical protein